MASDQLPAILVARYLKAHHFEKTLSAFLSESNIDESLATTNPGDWTLETLVNEKVQFDKSLNFEKTSNDTVSAWTNPAPSKPVEPLISSVNILSVNAADDGTKFVVTTADNRLTLLNGTQRTNDANQLATSNFTVDSPILSTVFLTADILAFTTMSGKVFIVSLNNFEVLNDRRDHTKWSVKIAARDKWLATAGWDQRVNVYQLDDNLMIKAPPQNIILESDPESLVFVEHPDTHQLHLIISRRDSSFLYYYVLEDSKFQPAGRQNLAPHSNAWVAFTPSALSLHPSDRTLLAVGTSHLPHMKVIIVRLLFPGSKKDEPLTVASTARANLALQDREDAAITLQVSVQAPQTPYSTPQIVWRPDGSGLWTNGDDGVIRGVEAKTGKVVTLLRGHEVGSKVRTLWAGYLQGSDGEPREVLVSGGFDKKVFVWEITD